MWLDAIGIHELLDDGIGEQFGDGRFALSRDVTFRVRWRGSLWIKDPAGGDDGGIGAECRVRFAGMRLGEPLLAGLSRLAMRAAMQRTEDHVVECAPRMLGQIDILPAEQAAKRLMPQDPAHRPDLDVMSACLLHARHEAPPYNSLFGKPRRRRVSRS